MSEKTFLEKLASGFKAVPEKIELPAIQQLQTAETQKRAESFLNLLSQTHEGLFRKFDKVQQRERTLYRLQENARLEVHHASGAFRFAGGFEPMDRLFEKIPDQKELIGQLETTARQFDFPKMIGNNESLEFERLWQIKAASVSKDGKESPHVLCRSVGAYRHFVNKIPVYGAASASIKLTGNQDLDAFTFIARKTTGKSVGTERVVSVEEGAKRIYRQLTALSGRTKTPVFETASPTWTGFGYMNFSPRKKQEILIPAYIAMIDIETKDLSQGYVLIAPATDNPKLVPSQTGARASGQGSKR